MSEATLAARVVLWLRLAGHDVYQEVSLGYGERRADIVAVRTVAGEREVWIIETKLRLSWDALAQVDAWEGYGHFRSVATELGPRGAGRHVAAAAIARLGMGWIRSSFGEIREEVAAPRAERAGRAGILLDLLRAEHATFAPAGNAEGKFWTEWRESCRALAEVVASEPGIELGLAVARMKHHYSTNRSAVSAFARQIERGIIDRVRAGEGEGRGARLVLVPEEPTFSGREAEEST